MRIAQVAPLAEAVPPKLYGGTERVVSWLTEELVELGHDVTLFASGDSETSAKLKAIWPKSFRVDTSIVDKNTLRMAMLEQVRKQAHEFDLLHFHLEYWPLSIFMRQKTPFLASPHGRLDLKEQQYIYNAFPAAPLVAISKSQRQSLPHTRWIGTVHHGVPERLLTPTGTEPRYLAFLGRIAPEKGVESAIRIAAASGLPLKIAAKLEKHNTDYFIESVLPILTSNNAKYIGEITDAEKSDFLSGAIALLFPIAWPEPFGLVMIEAMACGTPVIGYNAASVPEIIENGVTGFIVENEEEAVGALKKVHQLSRETIRKNFEERFTAKRMALEYLNIYQTLIRNRFKSKGIPQSSTELEPVARNRADF